MNSPFLLWLTGASGVGKSTAFHLLEARNKGRQWRFVHLDGESVPARDVVNAQTAQMSNIQEFLAYYWVEMFVNDEHEVIVMDAQAHPRFVTEACQHFGLSRYCIVLFHSDWEVMSARLSQRGQPELATPEMQNWSAHLLAYAQSTNLPVIDTSHWTPEEVVEWIEAQVNP
ncbi:hypothetical protein IAD21_02595 [Abditibacteriota bacterium]|nr:hypothetical protein IAD21_02595 [Abditibacteriota bacterium]